MKQFDQKLTVDRRLYTGHEIVERVKNRNRRPWIFGFLTLKTVLIRFVLRPIGGDTGRGKGTRRGRRRGFFTTVNKKQNRKRILINTNNRASRINYSKYNFMFTRVRLLYSVECVYNNKLVMPIRGAYDLTIIPLPFISHVSDFMCENRCVV